MEEDIRWQQRFQNYEKAFLKLQKFNKQKVHNELERQGFIKCFEYTYELSWQLLKDYLQFQGIVGITGSRDAIREAFNKDIIIDGEQWMKMINDRILTVHTYNEETATEVENRIRKTYFNLFEAFYIKMKNI